MLMPAEHVHSSFIAKILLPGICLGVDIGGCGMHKGSPTQGGEP